MKKIKVSIQDENTLVLLEGASQGDTIDLRSIHETEIDKSTIDSVVKSIKLEKFHEEVKKETKIIEERLAYQLKEKEMEWRENEQKRFQEKEREIQELKSKNDRAEIEKKLAINEALGKIEKERDALEKSLKTKELEKENIENT